MSSNEPEEDREMRQGTDRRRPRRPRLWLRAAVPAVVIAVGAGGWLGSATPAGATTTHHVYHYLNGVACPSASACVSVGATTSDEEEGSGAVVSGTITPIAYRSDDGGRAWSEVRLPGAGSADLYGVACATTTRCVAVGAHQVVSNASFNGTTAVAFSTSDAGRTWKAASLPGPMPGLVGVACPSPTHCVAVGGRTNAGTLRITTVALVSDDSGSRWSAASLPDVSGQLLSVSCSSSTTCVADGADPYLANGDFAASKPFGLRSTDGGRHWANVGMPDNAEGSGGPTAVDCPTARVCVSAGDTFTWCYCGTGTAGRYGDEWSSDDGGTTWTNRSFPTLGGFDVWDSEAISCWSATACAVAAYGTPDTRGVSPVYYPMVLVLTAAGGWAPLRSPGPTSGLRDQYIYGLACRSATDCVAVGSSYGNDVAVEVGFAGHWTSAVT
jgi:hypothetical protein